MSLGLRVRRSGRDALGGGGVALGSNGASARRGRPGGSGSDEMALPRGSDWLWRRELDVELRVAWPARTVALLFVKSPAASISEKRAVWFVRRSAVIRPVDGLVSVRAVAL